MDTTFASETFDTIIVGAGIAGLAAARHLRQAGYKALVLEKSRGVGGRLATRRLDGQSFDNGAHFFSAQADAFASELKRWKVAELARLWFSEAGRELYAGTPSMNGLAKEMAEGIEVQRQQLVTHIRREDDLIALACDNDKQWWARKVLFTCPMPQALAIVGRSAIELEGDLHARLAAVRYDPCITLLLRLKSDCGIGHPGFVKGVNEILDTITDVRRKGTSSQPGLVAHSTASFAESHYDQDRSWLEGRMIKAVEELYPLKIEESYLHKWRFAHRRGEGAGDSFAASKVSPLYFAGDSFGAATVEGAYCSGLAAGKALASGRVTG